MSDPHHTPRTQPLNPNDLDSIADHFRKLFLFRHAISGVLHDVPSHATGKDCADALREIFRIQADLAFRPPGMDERNPPEPPPNLHLVD